MKEFKEFDDCLYCEKHTKNLWSVLCVQEYDGEPLIAGGISEDSNYIIEDRRGMKSVVYLPTAGEGLHTYGTPVSNFNDIFLLQVCEKCKKLSIRDPESGKLLYPRKPDIENPHKDMPDNIKEIYNEARLIVDDSPRAALALNRLALDMLCDEVGATGRNLEVKIDNLGEKGILDSELVRIAHGVRGLGNGAVHPRNIDEQASKKDSEVVFALLNLITDETIAKKKRISFFSETYGKDARNK